MQDQLLQVIEKNLPSEVGKTLQKKLEQAGQDEESLRQAIIRIESLVQSNKKLEEENKSLKDERDNILTVESLNIKTEKELQKKQIELDKSMAELKSQEAEKRADQLKEVLGIVFKSPVYRRQYNESNCGTSNSDYNNGQNKTVPLNIPSSKSIS